MTTPNIVKGQIALDPTNDLLYYVNESSTIVATSLSWVKNNSNISTVENVVISGDLTVSGSTVTVNVETLLIEDNIIVLNTGITGAPSSSGAIETTRNAGIEVERGTSTNVQIRWNESIDKWQLTNDGTNFYDILNSSGITGNLTGNVTGNLTGNSAGTHTGAVVGNADTATKLLNARTISLTGPVTGSVSFDGTSNVSITTLLTAESSGIASLSDVTITSVASGDLLKYNGTAWVNAAGYATLASPTFTGTVSGITATMVGLGNVNNTSDTAKPVSTAQQTALDLKANLASPTFTGTVTVPTPTSNTDASTKAYVDSTASTTASNASTALTNHEADTTNIHGIVDTSILVTTTGSQTLTNKTITSPSGLIKGDVGLGNVNNTSDATQDAATATLTNKTLTTPVINSPTGIVKGDVGLGNVDNTADTAKPVSTATQTALGLKAPLASPTFTGTVNTSILFVDSIEVDTTGATSGQVLKYNGTKFAPAADNVATAGSLNITDLADVTVSGMSNGQILKWSSSTSKWINSADNAGTVINALDDIGDVTITSAASGDLLKWSGSVWINDSTSLAAKAPLASPTFTGTVSGITKTMVGLGNVDNTADTAKPVSTAQQTAIDLKANIASPTFTGTVTIPSGASISGFALLASPSLSGVPTAPTAAASTNTTQVATTAFVRAEVAALVNSAGATLDTLGEIATALGNDAALSTTLTNSIALKAPLASPTFTGTVTLPANTVTSSMILDGTIANIDINASAAIAYSKLSLSGAITTTDLATGAARSGFRSHIVTQQGATHTIAASDVGGLVVLSSCTSVVIPTADGTFTVGDRIDFLQTGSQVVTFSATAPQTVGGFDSQTKLGGQYAVATLVKYAANTWVLVGNITS